MDIMENDEIGGGRCRDSGKLGTSPDFVHVISDHPNWPGVRYWQWQAALTPTVSVCFNYTPITSRGSERPKVGEERVVISLQVNTKDEFYDVMCLRSMFEDRGFRSRVT